MAEQVGRKLQGAMAKSPSVAGLTRIGPGMYRDKGGKVVGPQGQKLPQIDRNQPQQMAPMAGQAAPMPGMGGAPQDLGGFQPGQVQAIGQEMGAGQGMGGMYTKPAIISGPMGGEPIRQLRPMPNFGAGQVQNGMGMPRSEEERRFFGAGLTDQIFRSPPGAQPDGSIYGAAMGAAPMPQQRQPMPSAGMIGGNFLGRRPNR